MRHLSIASLRVIGRPLSLFILCLIISAQATEAPKFTIEATSSFGSNGIDAIPVRVSVEALVGTPAKIRISNGSASAEKTVVLNEGFNEFELLLPPFTRNIRDSVTLSLPNGSIIRNTHIGVYDEDGYPLILVDNDTALRETISDSYDSYTSTSHRHRSHSGSSFVHKINPDEAPHSWQGWPTASAIAITDAGWSDMEQRQQTALLRHLRATGKEAYWQTPPAHLHNAQQRLPNDIASNTDFVKKIDRSFQDAISIDDPDSIPGTEDVPATIFLITAVLFAIIAGPVLMVKTKQRGERWRIFIYMPILSAGTCILLLGWGFLAEGWTIRRSAQQLVTLYPDGEALIRQQVSWYAPFGIGNFSLPASGNLQPVSRDEWEAIEESWRRHYAEENANGLRFNLDNGIQTSGAWVPARQNRTLLATHSEAWSDHLAVSAGADGPVIHHRILEHSGRLQEIFYCDDNGKFWKSPAAATLQPGQSIALEPATGAHAKSLRRTHHLHDGTPHDESVKSGPGTLTALWLQPELAILGPNATDVTPPLRILHCWPRNMEDPQ